MIHFIYIGKRVITRTHRYAIARTAKQRNLL